MLGPFVFVFLFLVFGACVPACGVHLLFQENRMDENINFVILKYSWCFGNKAVKNIRLLFGQLMQ